MYNPPNPLSNNMLRFLESEAESDVAFSVDDEVIKAHSQILHANAPILADMCKERSNDAPIVINGVSTDVFNMLLRFIYSGELPDLNDMLSYGNDIIKATDRFSIVELKMAVETALVRNCVVDMTNVASYLVFADAMTCPLLKEYAEQVFLLYAQEVLESESSKELQESPKLMSELLFLSSTASNPYNNASKQNQQPRLLASGLADTNCSVTQLREALDELGLDVDGSKEILIERLKGDTMMTEEDETSDVASDDFEVDTSNDEFSFDGESM
jgi:hypothetical protein